MITVFASLMALGGGKAAQNAKGFTLPWIARQAAKTRDEQRNRDLCLTGRYPASCDYTQLTADEQQRAKAAERAYNLEICLTGRYPASCDYAQLTADEQRGAKAAERAYNLEICLTGRYPQSCKDELLTADERRAVRAMQTRENLTACRDGKRAEECDERLLSPEELASVRRHLSLYVDGTLAYSHPPMSPQQRADALRGHRLQPKYFSRLFTRAQVRQLRKGLAYIARDDDVSSDQVGLTVCWIRIPSELTRLVISSIKVAAPLNVTYAQLAVQSDILMVTGGYWQYLGQEPTPVGLVISHGEVGSKLAPWNEGGLLYQLTPSTRFR